MSFDPSPARSQAGFTLIELLLVVTIIGIISAIAVPGFTRARGAAWEASTIASLRAIHSAQASFALSCGGGFYAPSIPWLARRPKGSTTGFIGAEFTANSTVRQGYRIRFTRGALAAAAPATCNGLGRGRTTNTFFVAADVLVAKGPVTRYFGVNASGVIYQSTKRVRVTQEGTPPAPARPIG